MAESVVLQALLIRGGSKTQLTGLRRKEILACCQGVTAPRHADDAELSLSSRFSAVLPSALPSLLSGCSRMRSFLQLVIPREGELLRSVGQQEPQDWVA